MIMRLSFSIVGLLLCSICYGQDQMLDDLSYYGDVMVNAFEAKHRVRAKAKFEPLFDQYITQGKYKTDDWKAVEAYTRIVRNEDDSVVFITYQVNEGQYPWTYGGFVLTNGTVTKLNHESILDEDSEYRSYSSEDWYGALYYNMMPIKGNPDSYLLFGYQYSDEFDKSKFIDVVTLDEDGMTFGKELFITRVVEGRDDIKQRVLLSYSSDTNVSFNYNESIDMIIFDHLMPRMGQQLGQGQTYVPDGTYEGYQYEKGSFVYVEKIFDHIYEEAPRPNPVFDDSKKNKDIHGRNRK